MQREAGNKSIRIGILALQGAVVEHRNMLEAIDGVEAVYVRKAEELEALGGLILPGGESTAIGKLMENYGLTAPIVDKAQKGMPVWGTCAGMILMAKRIAGQEKTYLNLLDVTVKRNAYGSQLDSFETGMRINGVADREIPLVFIRAPYIEQIEAGKNVDILAELEGHIIAVRQGNLLATSFHPELTADTAFHRYFAEMCRK